MIGFTVFDWIVVGWVLLVVFGVAFFFRGRASESFDEFVLSGRSLPWWLLGTSMIATSFASDTPLAVTGLVAKNGVAGNWIWWALLVGSTFTVYLFAGPWRRSGLTTDLELAQLRYGGFPGEVLRAFRALYMSFLYVGLILGWVISAMVTVLGVALNLGPESSTQLTWCLCGIALVYTLSSGLWGVVATDLLQFVLMIGGSVVLAIFAWHDAASAGGISVMLSQTYGSERAGQMLSFLPTSSTGWAGMGAMVFGYYLTVQWWASVYPGSEPGGGSYVAQRMLAARSERDARLGTLLYTVVHFAIRPWPWIVVALWAVAKYRPTGDAAIRESYARAMVDLLPPGLFGMMIAGFFAAFMSTVDTLLTLAGSYLVNDLYRPFLARRRSDRHYVGASRVAIVLVLVAGVVVAQELGRTQTGIDDAWRILIAFGSGSGLVLILRWYWWRISAFSEIAAMIAAFYFATCLDPNTRELVQRLLHVPDAVLVLPPDPVEVTRLLGIVGLTTASWLIVTFVTPAVRADRLDAFYRRVRPAGAWGRVAARCPDVRPSDSLGADIILWLLATAFSYCVLFAVGKLLFGETAIAVSLGAFAGALGLLLWGGERVDPV